LDLNSTTREELESLIILNSLQVEALLNHIKENGRLIALEELQTIDGFDLQTIYRILPYVTLDNTIMNPKISLRRLSDGKSSLFLRWQQVSEKSKGFLPKNIETGDTNRYLGRPAKIYKRYRY